MCLAGYGVGTTVATALASSLKQLQHLSLADCGLELGDAQGLACLQAIGCLTQLTSLELAASANLGLNSGLTQQGLMQLTGLSRLQQLDCRNLISDKKLQRFWAALQGDEISSSSSSCSSSSSISSSSSNSSYAAELSTELFAL
jgi:hypothetical protein